SVQPPRSCRSCRDPRHVREPSESAPLERLSSSVDLRRHNYCPKRGAFAQRGANQVDGLFSIHLPQDCSFTEPEPCQLTSSNTHLSSSPQSYSSNSSWYISWSSLG